MMKITSKTNMYACNIIDHVNDFGRCKDGCVDDLYLAIWMYKSNLL